MKPFQPGEKVIKRTEKDARNWGEVMDVSPTPRKQGHIAVYFQRQVWIKPENLMHYEEWQAKQQGKAAPQGSIKDYWTKGK